CFRRRARCLIRSCCNTSARCESMNPFLPLTPPDAIPGTIRERVILGRTTFLIDRPENSDDMLDHPVIRAAFERDEYMPYWADLWPSARMLAKAILAETWPPGLTALEVGCGLGLPGIAALAQGLRVILDRKSTRL